MACCSRLHKGSVLFVYMQCYFVTIATILGTGVLGLPVTLAHSGLYPFLVTFIIAFFMQALVIYFVTDILQRAYAVQLQAVKECGRGENVPLYSLDDDEDQDLNKDSDGSEMNHHDHVHASAQILLQTEDEVRAPNLHMLGEFFLGCGVRQLFNVILILGFVAILVSYALAGSEAYAELIGISHFYVIPVFVSILTLLIVFMLTLIQPVVSLFTFIKGSLLLGTVVVTFFVGTSMHMKIKNDFLHVGDPLLMGTVALGGVFQTMPMLYEKIKPVPNQILNFRRAVLLAITTCTVLNILWCWAVLEIVPQTADCGGTYITNVLVNESVFTTPEESPHSTTKSAVLLLNDQTEIMTTIDYSPRSCFTNITLERAASNGEISTVPLTQIIHEYYPSVNWIAFLVEMFIIISITVSYLTIGAAMHHTLSGWVDSFWESARLSAYQAKIHLNPDSKFCKLCSNQFACSSAVSLLVFASVFAIAMIDPKGFVNVLEKFASLTLNLQSGVFVFLMIRRSAYSSSTRSLTVPLPLPAWFSPLQFLLPIYFGFAVGYDVYKSIYDIIHTHEMV